MQRIASVFFGWVLVLGWATGSLADGPYTVRGVVAAYRDYLNSVRNVSFRALMNDRDAKDRQFSNPRDEDWKIDLVGHRSWHGTLIDGQPTGDPAILQLSYFESLATPERQICLDSNPKTMRADVVCAYLNVLPEMWKPGGYPELPLGYLDTGDGKISRFSDLLTGPMTVKWQTGRPVELTCRTAGQRLTLWLDASKGWMPERIEYRRLAPATEGGQLTYLSYTVQHARQIDGIWFPERFTTEQMSPAGKHQNPAGLVERVETVVEDGVEKNVTVGEIVVGAPGSVVDIPAFHLVAEVQLADARINSLSDADFQLKATIPNGTKVGMQDDFAHNYIWQDGKAVLVPR